MRRFLALISLVSAALVVTAIPSESVLRQPRATFTCSASLQPPAAYHGACGTFNGRTTWYGSQWVGSPLPVGWGLCAWPAAHGGSYPHGAYRYSPADPPNIISMTSMNAVGWAFSEATRRGWMANGRAGQFSADDVSVAAKLLYDALAYSLALPAVSPAQQRALTALAQLVAIGRNVADTPSISITLDGGGTTLSDHGTLLVSVRSPSGVIIPDQNVTLRLTGATVNGQRSISVVTTATPTPVDFTSLTQDPSSITAAATASVAVPGLLFFDPTYLILDAQTVATPRAPRAIGAALTLNATGTPRGQIALIKTVDDAAYFGPGDATFTVLDPHGLVVATLTTGDDGLAGPTDPLPLGTYRVHEEVAPEGYASAPDQQVTLVANDVITLTIGPNDGDRAITGSFLLTKQDSGTHEVLPGAEFSLTRDPTHSHVANGDVATCTTNAQGQCLWSDLLPGYYFLAEVSPPANFLATFAGEWVWVGPGDAAGLDVTNDPAMVTLRAEKYNSAQTGTAIPGAVYDLYVRGTPTWATATAPEGSEAFPDLTFVERGTTSLTGQMTFSVRAGYEWCLREVSVPAEYIVDPDLHCTSAPVTQSSSDADATVALPEVASSLVIRLHKFNATSRSVGVPGAYYALFVALPYPTGFTAPDATNVTVPGGYGLWEVTRTGSGGYVDLSIPSGHHWCVREIYAPSGYFLDPALHCTSGVLSAQGHLAPVTLSAPEVALPVTGGDSGVLVRGGLALLGLGLVVWRRQALRSWWAAITK